MNKIKIQSKIPNEISWKTFEYRYYPKTVRWYVIMGVLASAMLAYPIYTRDIVMLATLSMMFSIMFIYARRKPRRITVTLSETGISFGQTSYPYSAIKSFWLHYNPPYITTLNIETTDYINRNVSIELAEQDPNKVREFLLPYLSEDLEREEPYTDQLLRSMRF